MPACCRACPCAEVGIEMKFKDMRYPVLIGATHVPELNAIEVRLQCPRWGSNRCVQLLLRLWCNSLWRNQHLVVVRHGAHAGIGVTLYATQVEEGGVHLGASVTLSKLMHAFHQLIDTLPAYKVGGECFPVGQWGRVGCRPLCVYNVCDRRLIKWAHLACSHFRPLPCRCPSPPLRRRRHLGCGRWWSSCAGLRAHPSETPRRWAATSARPAPSQVPACLGVPRAAGLQLQQCCCASLCNAYCSSLPNSASTAVPLPCCTRLTQRPWHSLQT